jgi:ATP-binding cassette, subfamily B, bacterial MsbA
MKEFFRLLRRFVPPYKKYLIWALFLNLLSAILNIFSFALIIPILQILFKMDTKTYEFIPWDAAGINMKDIAVNNFYYYVTEMIASQGGSLTLLILGVFLAVMTLLKAFSYFASSASSSHRSPVPSVLPSSTRHISKSSKDCASKLFMHTVRKFFRL